MGGDAWDITRNTFYPNKHTHVWENLDGSKTYRFDTPGRTSFETRSPQSVTAEKQFKQELVVAAISILVIGVSAFFEWLDAPQSSTHASR